MAKLEPSETCHKTTYRTVTPARSSVKLGLLSCAGNEIA